MSLQSDYALSLSSHERLTHAATVPHHARMGPKKARKPMFTEAQKNLLVGVVNKHLKAKTFKNQTEMALALGITQPSLSSLADAKWSPGVSTAEHIAALEKMTLEQLIGPYSVEGLPSASPRVSPLRLDNLEVCVRFYEGKKTWSPWTIAAARAGFFGEGDVPPPQWAERLDMLEKALSKAPRP